MKTPGPTPIRSGASASVTESSFLIDQGADSNQAPETDCGQGDGGGQWNASAINDGQRRRNGILNNAPYLGRIAFNRQSFVKDPEAGKRVSRLNAEHEWVIADVPALRIVDDETREKVRAIKARYASQRGNKRQTKRRLLTGLAKCGCCSGSMTIFTRDRSHCSAKRERGARPGSVGIKVDTSGNWSGQGDVIVIL